MIIRNCSRIRGPYSPARPGSVLVADESGSRGTVPLRGRTAALAAAIAHGARTVRRTHVLDMHLEEQEPDRTGKHSTPARRGTPPRPWTARARAAATLRKRAGLPDHVSPARSSARRSLTASCRMPAAGIIRRSPRSRPVKPRAPSSELAGRDATARNLPSHRPAHDARNDGHAPARARTRSRLLTVARTALAASSRRPCRTDESAIVKPIEPAQIANSRRSSPAP
jgi:hypothetical protein